MSSSALLEPAKYLILLALAEGPNHGLALQKIIIGDTLGVYLNTSTIYDALKSLSRYGLVEELSDTPHRRTYQLTQAGADRLERQSRIFQITAQISQQRLRWH